MEQTPGELIRANALKSRSAGSPKIGPKQYPEYPEMEKFLNSQEFDAFNDRIINYIQQLESRESGGNAESSDQQAMAMIRIIRSVLQQLLDIQSACSERMREGMVKGDRK